MKTHRSETDTFTTFVESVEPRLRQALVASFGPDTGLEAVAEALAFGWERWDRISVMDNPAGYLYRVGVDRARSRLRAPVMMPPVVPDRLPWVEPALPGALGELSESQRTCVVLVHTYGHSLSEVAELLGVSKSTVQKHTERAIKRLRKALGVEL